MTSNCRNFWGHRLRRKNHRRLLNLIRLLNWAIVRKLTVSIPQKMMSSSVKDGTKKIILVHLLCSWTLGAAAHLCALAVIWNRQLWHVQHKLTSKWYVENSFWTVDETELCCRANLWSWSPLISEQYKLSKRSGSGSAMSSGRYTSWNDRSDTIYNTCASRLLPWFFELS